MTGLWSSVEEIVAANRAAAARARDEGDPRRAATHDAAAADRLEAQ